MKQRLSDKKIFEMFRKESDNENLEKNVTKNNLLGIIALIPAFAPEMFYEAFDYETPYNIVRVYLSQLVKEKLVAKCPLTGKDTKIRVLYYITDMGYKKACELFPEFRFPEYKSKKGRHFSHIGMHDLGVGICAMASFLSIEDFFLFYEYDGGTKEVPIRSDIAWQWNTRGERIILYHEFDTGAEKIQTLTEKLKKYTTKFLFRSQDVQSGLVIAFRRNYAQMPFCFRFSYVEKIIKDMEQGERLQEYFMRANNENAKILREFQKYTPAVLQNWDQTRLEEYYKDLRYERCREKHEYLRENQIEFTKRRRNSMIDDILYDYYPGGELRYDNDTGSFFEGGDVFAVSAMSYDECLPYMCLKFYPEIQNWICNVLNRYDYNTRFVRDVKEFNLGGRKSVKIGNIFQGGTFCSIVEYLSGSVSAFFRFLELKKKAEDYLFIGIVDDLKDMYYFDRKFARYRVKQVYYLVKNEYRINRIVDGEVREVKPQTAWSY